MDDILSSIRRLVADQPPPAESPVQRAQPPVRAGALAAPAPLLLTPQQRVAEEPGREGINRFLLTPALRVSPPERGDSRVAANDPDPLVLQGGMRVTAAEEAQEGAPLSGEVMDEAALRRLITEILREELQGALGERITRNMRKLARREVYRTLAAQEID